MGKCFGVLQKLCKFATNIYHVLTNHYEKKSTVEMLVLKECIQKLTNFKQTFGGQFGITRMGIFGSVARKENTEDSDIDIVVEINKPSLSGMYELRQSLRELFGCDVDLVRYRQSLRPLFRSNINNDVIYV